MSKAASVIVFINTGELPESRKTATTKKETGIICNAWKTAKSADKLKGSPRFRRRPPGRLF
jgi:hypothetical protein